MNATNNFTLRREEAAELLNKNVRTIDRYVKQGTLKHISLGAKQGIRISKSSAEELLAKQEKIQKPQNKKVDTQPQKEAKTPENEKTQDLATLQAAEIYKKLYEETSNKLDAAQKRLEGANYRVGELESQMKNSVPLLEFRNMEEDKKSLKTQIKKLDKEVEDSVKTNYKLISEIDHSAEIAKIEAKKNIFHIILSAVLFVALTFFVVFYFLGQ